MRTFVAEALRVEECLTLSSHSNSWALGYNPNTGRQGAFPMVCVAKPDEYNKGGNIRQPGAVAHANTPYGHPQTPKRVSSAVYSPADLGRWSEYDDDDNRVCYL